MVLVIQNIVPSSKLTYGSIWPFPSDREDLSSLSASGGKLRPPRAEEAWSD